MRKLWLFVLLLAAPAFAQGPGIQPGSGMYREDAAHTSGDYGVFTLAVRTAIGNGLCGGDTRYCSLQVDSNGALHVIFANTSLAVTQSGSWSVTADSELPAAAALSDNFANPTAPAVGAFTLFWDGATWDRWTGAVTCAACATSAKQDTLQAVAENTDINVLTIATAVTQHDDPLVSNSGMQVQGRASSTVPSDVSANNDATRLWLLRSGLLPTTLRDAAGSAVGTAGAPLRVDPTGSTTQPVDTELPAAAALADNTANPTAPAVGAFTLKWDGATWDRWDGSVSCSNCSGSGASDVDDSSFGIGTDSVAPLGILVDETTPDSADEGDSAFARGSANRNLYTQIRDGEAGNERGAAVTAANALKTDGSAVTQPVSAASLPLPSGAATSANQTTEIGHVDGLEALLTSADGLGAAAPVRSEDQASATGQAGHVILTIRQDTLSTTTSTDGDYQPPKTNADGRLYTSTTVDAALPAGNNNIGDVDVASSALPTGAATEAKQDTGNTSLGVIDDWDESDRAKVNPIAGQAGVAGGAGTSGATTQRVVVAYDSGVCNPKDTSQVAVAVSSSGNTELVALTSSQTIYVCNVLLIASGTVAAQLIYGTGSACATGETDMTGPMDLVAQAGFSTDFDGRLKTAEANALCIELSGAVAVNGVVTYRKAATF